VLVIPDGIEGLRALDRAVGGELYRLLGICQDEGYKPKLGVTPTGKDDEFRLDEVFLFFDGLGELDQPMVSGVWTISVKEHPGAMSVALRMLIDAASARAKGEVELMQAGLRALERLEKPEAT